MEFDWLHRLVKHAKLNLATYQSRKIPLCPSIICSIIIVCLWHCNHSDLTVSWRQDLLQQARGVMSAHGDYCASLIFIQQSKSSRQLLGASQKFLDTFP